MNAFEDCVAKGRLKKIDIDAERVAHELTTAKDEIEQGLTYFEKGNWSGVAVQAYFAMSHCARGALASQGYRDTNFYALCVGIEQLFVQDDVLQPDVTKQIRTAKEIKDGVENRRRASAHEARRHLSWALAFVKAIFERLALPGFKADEIPLALPQTSQPRSEERQPRDSGESRQPSSNEGRRWRADDPRHKSRESRRPWNASRSSGYRSISELDRTAD